MHVYGDLGPIYGAHQDRTYGTLFTPDEPPVEGLVVLLARVDRVEVLASVDSTSLLAQVTTDDVLATVVPNTIVARITTPNIGYTLN